MAWGITDINKFFEPLKAQALDSNDKSMITWSKYKSDLEETKFLVSLISKKIKHNVMVPIGNKALMRGKIVHTNEYLVNLGETWFVKSSAHQTLEICDRRIKNCDEMIEKLQKEKELIVNKCTVPTEQEAFGSEERPEIIEFVSEEENEKWKKQHRIKEKKYRQQLAEIRKAEKTRIKTEQDLWKHLDELELQEELEDELNRLNAEYSSEEEIGDESFKSEYLSIKRNQNLGTSKEEENSEDENKRMKNISGKRMVSFACDFNSSDNEPLLLEIKHSETEPIPHDPNCKQINSPADIYHYHLNIVNKMPLSALKNKLDTIKKTNLELFHYDDEDNSQGYDDEVLTSSCVYLKDVTEKCTSNMSSTQKTTNKKISKFKLCRKKNS